MINKGDIVILESAKCRQIVNEIMDFGVSQEQIETIIRLLALELEDRETMVAIRNYLDKTGEDSPSNKIVT